MCYLSRFDTIHTRKRRESVLITESPTLQQAFCLVKRKLQHIFDIQQAVEPVVMVLQYELGLEVPYPAERRTNRTYSSREIADHASRPRIAKLGYFQPRSGLLPVKCSGILSMTLTSTSLR